MTAAPHPRFPVKGPHISGGDALTELKPEKYGHKGKTVADLRSLENSAETHQVRESLLSRTSSQNISVHYDTNANSTLAERITRRLQSSTEMHALTRTSKHAPKQRTVKKHTHARTESVLITHRRTTMLRHFDC
jgi:hypothetical protein